MLFDERQQARHQRTGDHRPQAAHQRAVDHGAPHGLPFERADADRREYGDAGGDEADRRATCCGCGRGRNSKMAPAVAASRMIALRQVRSRDRYDADQRDRGRQKQGDFLLVGDRDGHAEQASAARFRPANRGW